MKFRRVNEGIIFDDKNKYINFDKFESGEENVLLITGFSGAGKSTFTNKFAKEYDAIPVEIDDVCFLLNKYGNEFYNQLEPGEPILKFIKSNPDFANLIGIDYEDYPSYEEYEITCVEMINKFFNWIINYAHKNRNNRFIINGLQLADGTINKSSFKDLPMIIIGSSVVKSSVRATKRNTETSGNKLRTFNSVLKQNMNQYKHMKESIMFNDSFLMESRYNLHNGEKLIELTPELIKHYNLKHIRDNSEAYAYIDSDDNLIGYCAVENKSDGKWIQAIEASKNHRGEGWGKRLLHLCCSELHATLLLVRKTNKVAINMYKNYGFTIVDENDYQYIMKIGDE